MRNEGKQIPIPISLNSGEADFGNKGFSFKSRIEYMHSNFSKLERISAQK